MKGERPRIRRVAVVAKTGPTEGIRIAGELGAWLRDRGIRVEFDAETARALGDAEAIARDRLPEDTDLAIVAGGDGTLLSVARSASPLGVPILSVNFGGLGFLTELQPDELFPGLSLVLEGKYAVEERQTLRVRHLSGGSVRSEHAVLNDAVLTKAALARMITLVLRIDDEQVVTYTSDGLIVSTATGSTAYALSAGGPILDPRMRAFVIAPICPHTMTYRPLVVPGFVQVEAVLRSDTEKAFLTLDGQVGIPLRHQDSIRVDEHPRPVRLVRVAHRSFFEVLRKKLRWGER